MSREIISYVFLLFLTISN